MAGKHSVSFERRDVLLFPNNVITLILETIGSVFFALGMCMAMLPEWGMFNQGVICGVIGLVILLITLLAWRKMTGKAPIKISGKAVLSVAVGIAGALLLGVGMCLTMVFSQMAGGIVVGLIGIVVLLCLIPLVKGLHD